MSGGGLMDLDVHIFEDDDEHVASVVCALVRAVLADPRVDQSIARRLSKEVIWSKILLTPQGTTSLLPFIGELPQLPHPTKGRNIHNYISELVQKLPDPARELFESEVETYDICNTCGLTRVTGRSNFDLFRVKERDYSFSTRTGRTTTRIGIDDVNAFAKTLDSSWLPDSTKNAGQCPRCGNRLRRHSIRLLTPSIAIFTLDDTFLGEIPQNFVVSGNPPTEAHLRLVITHPSERALNSGMAPRASMFVASMSSPGEFELIDTDHPLAFTRRQSKVKKILSTGRGFESGQDDIASIVIYQLDPVQRNRPLAVTAPPENLIPNTMKISDFNTRTGGAGSPVTSGADESYSYSYSYSYSDDAYNGPGSPTTTVTRITNSPVRGQLPGQTSLDVTMSGELNGTGYDKTSPTTDCCLIWTKMHIWWKIIILCLIPILILLIIVIVAIANIIKNTGIGSDPSLDNLTTKRLIVGREPVTASRSAFAKLYGKDETRAVPNVDSSTVVMRISGSTDFQRVVTEETVIDRGTGIYSFQSDDLKPADDYIPKKISFGNLNIDNLELNGLSTSNATLLLSSLTVEDKFTIDTAKVANMVEAENLTTVDMIVTGTLKTNNLHAESSYGLITFDTEHLYVTDLISAQNVESKNANVGKLLSTGSGSIRAKDIYLEVGWEDDTFEHSYERLRFGEVPPITGDAQIELKDIYVVGTANFTGGLVLESLIANTLNVKEFKPSNTLNKGAGVLTINQLVVSNCMKLGGDSQDECINAINSTSNNKGIEAYLDNTVYNINVQSPMSAPTVYTASSITIGTTDTNGRYFYFLDNPNNYSHATNEELFYTPKLIADNGEFVEEENPKTVGNVYVTDELIIKGEVNLTGTTTVKLPNMEKVNLNIKYVEKELRMYESTELIMKEFVMSSTAKLNKFTFNGTMKIKETLDWTSPSAISLSSSGTFNVGKIYFDTAKGESNSVMTIVEGISKKEEDGNTNTNGTKLITVKNAVTTNVNKFYLKGKLPIRSKFDSCTYNTDRKGSLLTQIPAIENLTANKFVMTGSNGNLTIETLDSSSVGTLNVIGNDDTQNEFVKLTGTINVGTLILGSSLSVSNLNVSSALTVKNQILGTLITSASLTGYGVATQTAIMTGTTTIDKPPGITCQNSSSSSSDSVICFNWATDMIMDYEGALITESTSAVESLVGVS